MGTVSRVKRSDLLAFFQGSKLNPVVLCIQSREMLAALMNSPVCTAVAVTLESPQVFNVHRHAA